MTGFGFQEMQLCGYRHIINMLSPASIYGRELLKDLAPYHTGQEAALLREWENISAAKKAISDTPELIQSINRTIGQMKDVRHSIKAIANRPLSEVELFELRHLLLLSQKFLEEFAASQLEQDLQGFDFFSPAEPLRIIDPNDNKMLSFYIENNRSPALFKAREEKKQLENLLCQCMDETDRTNLSSARTKALAQEAEAENDIRQKISAQLLPYSTEILHNIALIAALDLTLQKAILANRYNAAKPRLTNDSCILKDAYNPMIADILQENGRVFTPISMETAKGTTVVTGANMGGKSVALKTILLNIALAASGFFAFASSLATPLFDSIHLVSGDSENVHHSLSSFGGDVLHLNEICDDLDRGSFSLIILDEFASGTNVEEGSAILSAVTQYLGKQNCIAFIATHYDGAAAVSQRHYQVIGLRNLDDNLNHSGFSGTDLISKYMDYGIFPVEKNTPVPHDATKICKLLNVRKEILKYL